MRHVKVQYLWVQQAVQSADIAAQKVRTQDNPADLLTKFVSSELLDKHSSRLGMTYTSPGPVQGSVQERIRCFAKHVALAEQQRKFLAQALLGGRGQGGVGKHPL